jgi:hypothetical protein
MFGLSVCDEPRGMANRFLTALLTVNKGMLLD